MCSQQGRHRSNVGALGSESSADRNAFFTAWNAAANLADMAGKVNVTLRAETNAGFDKSKLQNGAIRWCLIRQRAVESSHRRWTKESRQITRRWGGTVLLEPEKRFHRIQGYRQLPLLIEASAKTVDNQEAVA